jgi:7,8-dihydro-6-hydroxymethylpterin dimethyltransferase
MCGFHGEFIHGEDGLRPLFRSRSGRSCCGSVPSSGRGDPVRGSQNFVRFRWTRTRNGDPSAPGSSIDAFLNRVRMKSFSISGMAFQDEFNVDLARLRHCSVHSYHGGKLMPFCARNIYHKQYGPRITAQE